MNRFNEISLADFPINPFEIKKKWMLISATNAAGVTNTMTASWGGFGVMWGKEVVFVVIRPQRYTKEFVDNSESFSLSFFHSEYLKDLSYLGKVSGRDEDKIAKVGFTIESVDDVPYFSESETVIVAKKLYAQAMNPESFLDKEVEQHWYPNSDHHIMYIAEITKILNKTDE